MSAADSAITAPTDRSTPSVPITSAIPSATMQTGAACSSCVRKFAPDMKFLVKMRLNSSSTTTAMYTPYAWSHPVRFERSVFGRAAAATSGVRTSVIRAPFRDRGQYVALGDFATDELADDGAFAQDHHPVRAVDQLLHLRGDQQHTEPLGGQFVDQPLHLRLRPDVDAAGRLV